MYALFRAILIKCVDNKQWVGNLAMMRDNTTSEDTYKEDK